jgi:hypothetical protein
VWLFIVLTSGTRYSDVTHEVTEITAGYRFVLTYNLILVDQIQSPSSALVSENVRLIQRVLQAWQDQMASDSNYPFLIHLLGHEYTTSSLSPSKLKGQDLTVVNAIRQACEETGFSCFLASCQREVSGGVDFSTAGYGTGYYEDDPEEDEVGDDEYDDDEGEDKKDDEEAREFRQSRHANILHTIGDILEDQVMLREVVDFHGNVVAQNLPVNETDFLMDDPFSHLDPDDEEYTGFTGNEGCNVTHWYWNTVKPPGLNC